MLDNYHRRWLVGVNLKSEELGYGLEKRVNKKRHQKINC